MDGASLPGQTLSFRDTASIVAVIITPAIFVFSLVAQMELARKEKEEEKEYEY